MRHLLDSYGISNLLFNIFIVFNDEIYEKEYKNKQNLSKKELKTFVSKPPLHFQKWKE